MNCPGCGKISDADVFGQNRETGRNTWSCPNCEKIFEGALLECGTCKRSVWLPELTISEARALEPRCKVCKKDLSIEFWGSGEIKEHKFRPF